MRNVAEKATFYSGNPRPGDPRVFRLCRTASVMIRGNGQQTQLATKLLNQGSGTGRLQNSNKAQKDAT